jgi:hypothetical protein
MVPTPRRSALEMIATCAARSDARRSARRTNLEIIANLMCLHA